MQRSPVAGLVAASVRRPWLTIVGAVILAALALVVVADRFAMTTDTAALISPDVDWRRQERAMEAAFPQLTDAMLIMIDGATPELAEDGAARLEARLAEDKAHFRRVTRPDGGDYFARQGLLFGSEKEVRDATAALVEAQPMLTASRPGRCRSIASTSRSAHWPTPPMARCAATRRPFRGSDCSQAAAARSRRRHAGSCWSSRCSIIAR